MKNKISVHFDFLALGSGASVTLPSVKGRGIGKCYCKQIAEGHFIFPFITLKQTVLIRWTILQNRERKTIYLHKPKLVCRRLQNKAIGTQTLVCIRVLTEQY